MKETFIDTFENIILYCNFGYFWALYTTERQNEI